MKPTTKNNSKHVKAKTMKLYENKNEMFMT